MDNIFTITNLMLGQLTPQAAVEGFRDLLWAHAWRLRYPFNKPNDPLLGIATSYQIKSGLTFVPWQPSSIKKELFGRKDPTKPSSLGPAVRRCMDSGERYVLLCFGLDLTDDQRHRAVQNLVNAFELCGYSNPNVEAWGQNHLIGMLSLYPSVSLRLAGRDHLEFLSHSSWSMDAEMRVPLHLEDKQSQLIQAIRSCLRGTEITHIRVVGEPGVGKTRLVREATAESDLAPLVVFAPDGEAFQRSELLRLLLREDNRFHVILVIDECAPKDRASIWSALKGRSERVHLITLDHGPDDASDLQMQVLAVPPLDRKQISAIIRVSSTTTGN